MTTTLAVGVVGKDGAGGLTGQEAAQRLLATGANELPASKPANNWRIAGKVLSEPMLLLLIACGGIYLVLGDINEALVLLAFVFVIIGITFFQEHKTERALEALRDMSSPRAQVMRNGKPQSVPGREVVPGDILILAEGDRVAADAVLLSCLNMTVDESLLTGESLPVSKAAVDTAPAAMGSAGGEDTPFVFAGSMVVQGKGTAIVLATGTGTAIGGIGKALQSVDVTPTRVQAETASVVKYVALGSLALAVLLALWFGFSRSDWMAGTLVGLTFAMALIPEELPVVLTLFLGIGAWRIAKQRVLTRRIPVIETLGATTVLCVDKTGTLTQNKMAVAALFASGKVFDCTATQADLPEDCHEVLEYAILASHREPFDPMEVAIQTAGHSKLGKLGRTEHFHGSWGLIDEYPLSKELLAMSRVWASEDKEQYIIAAKGAPEAIADLCHLPEDQLKDLMQQVNRMAEQGLRVLGVARATFRPAQIPIATTAASSEELPENLPPIQHDFEFQLLGLIALADPIREGVPEAIKECQTAGIRVVMITGDYPATAKNIAAQCGMVSVGGSITGSELLDMDEAQLQQRIPDVSIFCRVAPEQKLRLVNALKASGEIVAMTGDGVNDAPALKAAHIGIAMGKRGTDVARESAAMVLLDDDFSAIVEAIRLGRRIFDNLRKTIAFIVAVHIPVIGMSFIPVLMGWPVVLMPVHILVLQLIIDPTCSLVFEAEQEEDDVMQRPPRKPDASIFNRQILWKGLLQGLTLLAAIVAMFYLARSQGLDTNQARTMAFTTMVLGNLGLIFINRSLSTKLLRNLTLPNPVLWWVVASALLILSLGLFVPALTSLFYFGSLPLMQLCLSAGTALICIAVIAAVKAAGWIRV
ncbi:cation-translocating P-type ATPase [Undibacterium sp. Ji49W]|uniref:cation-translocating P-type ATPase n=1 Tax=Undibacterium sp. Ji49W TaxID=3413040 RepID=UPI003BF2945F